MKSQIVPTSLSVTSNPSVIPTQRPPEPGKLIPMPSSHHRSAMPRIYMAPTASYQPQEPDVVKLAESQTQKQGWEVHNTMRPLQIGFDLIWTCLLTSIGITIVEIKTVVSLPYLQNGISYTSEITFLYWTRAQSNPVKWHTKSKTKSKRLDWPSYLPRRHRDIKYDQLTFLSNHDSSHKTVQLFTTAYMCVCLPNTYIII